MSNPVVFFDMTIGGRAAGRIEMTLRADGATTRARHPPTQVQTKRGEGAEKLRVSIQL